jgi:hypothetical protein
MLFLLKGFIMNNHQTSKSFGQKVIDGLKQFHDNLKKSEIFQYIRDRKGKKIGIMLGKKVAGQVYIGYSLCNISKEPFDKKRGLEIADGRITKYIEQGFVSEDEAIPHSIVPAFGEFYARAVKFFGQKPLWNNCKDITNPWVRIKVFAGFHPDELAEKVFNEISFDNRVIVDLKALPYGDICRVYETIVTLEGNFPAGSYVEDLVRFETRGEEAKNRVKSFLDSISRKNIEDSLNGQVAN